MSLSRYRRLSNSDYYISLFVPLIDISVSLGSLFQRIASINHRSNRSRLTKLLEKNEIVRIPADVSSYYFSPHSPSDRSI